MHNGMVKLVTGIRRCWKTYLLFNLFDDYLCSKIANGREQYYVFLDEVQYAISREELKNPDVPPRLYGVLNGLLRMRNVDVYVTGSNSKLLSHDVMTGFRGRGDEVRVRPLSFSEFMQGFDGDRYQGWAEYTVYGGMPLTLSMRTDERKARYLERLFEETYLKDVVERNEIRKLGELNDLVNVLASGIGTLTNPNSSRTRFEACFAPRSPRTRFPAISATSRTPSPSRRRGATT